MRLVAMPVNGAQAAWLGRLPLLCKKHLNCTCIVEQVKLLAPWLTPACAANKKTAPCMYFRNGLEATTFAIQINDKQNLHFE
jgi:hypothetical protein